MTLLSVPLEGIFSFCTWVALGGWVLLALAPKWRYTQRLVLTGGASLLIAGVYLIVVLSTLADENEGGFGSLEAVTQLFQNPKALLAGWIHYLAFDLFIGAWEVRDAQQTGLPHGWLLPCLFLTLMYGPIGLLLYFGVKATLKKINRLQPPQIPG